MVKLKYTTGGVLNQTAPDIKPHIKAQLMLSDNDMNEPHWDELQEWLAYQLGRYRMFNGECHLRSTGEKTDLEEQKKELQKYIDSLENALLCLQSSEMLHPHIAGDVLSVEYEIGIAWDADEIAAAHLIKKIAAAKYVQRKFESRKDRRGTTDTEQEYLLLHQLAEKIHELSGATKGESRAVAGKILNEDEAFGAVYAPFGNTPNPQKRKRRVVSEEPEGIKKGIARLRKGGLIT